MYQFLEPSTLQRGARFLALYVEIRRKLEDVVCLTITSTTANRCELMVSGFMSLHVKIRMESRDWHRFWWSQYISTTLGSRLV